MRLALLVLTIAAFCPSPSVATDFRMLRHIQERAWRPTTPTPRAPTYSDEVYRERMASEGPRHTASRPPARMRGLSGVIPFHTHTPGGIQHLGRVTADELERWTPPAQRCESTLRAERRQYWGDAYE